jgi:hypothetical protein
VEVVAVVTPTSIIELDVRIGSVHDAMGTDLIPAVHYFIHLVLSS